MVWCVAMTTPTLFRATAGLLEGIGGAEMKQNTEMMLGDDVFFFYTPHGESGCRKNKKQNKKKVVTSSLKDFQNIELSMFFNLWT